MRWIAIGTALVAVLIAAPVGAEHRTLMIPDESTERSAPAPSDWLDRWLPHDVDVQLKIGRHGFRLGTRAFGPDGETSASLNGLFGRGGLALDGRVHRHDGRVWRFKVDADVVGLLAQQALGWLLPEPARASE